MESVIRLINEKIIKHSGAKISQSLENGKLGICIYFFKLADLAKNREYRELAEKLIDEICQDLQSDTSIRSILELSHIVVGIDYLIENNYIEGDINEILIDFDEVIFKKITSGAIIDYNTQEPMHILYYIYIRLSKQKRGSDEYFILEELCIKIFNNWYLSLNSKFYDEPSRYTIQYKLPQLLYVLGKIYSLDFYNYRINEVIKEISCQILSRIPLLHANRLYLLWGLINIKRNMNIDIWDEQIYRLAQCIDCTKILNSELRSRDVFINDGISSIYLLLTEIENTPYKIQFSKKIFYEKIKDSDIWTHEQWIYEGLGLINGFSGLILITHMININKG